MLSDRAAWIACEISISNIRARTISDVHTQCACASWRNTCADRPQVGGHYSSWVTVTQTNRLIGASRCSLYLASRKYLLQNLYHGLQELSSEGESLLPSTDAEVEMDTLPTPSTATLPKNPAMHALKRTFHSTVSRILFCLCFSESCTLFALLILQGLDIFYARYVAQSLEQIFSAYQ